METQNGTIRLTSWQLRHHFNDHNIFFIQPLEFPMQFMKLLCLSWSDIHAFLFWIHFLKYYDQIGPPFSARNMEIRAYLVLILYSKLCSLPQFFFIPVVGLPVKTIEWITLPLDQMHKSSILLSYCHIHCSLYLPLILEINYHNHHKLIDTMRLQINTFADHISKACFKKIHYVEIMPCTGKNILSCAKRGLFYYIT